MEMFEFFQRLLDTSGFPPRWNCGTGWTGGLGWLHILSDLAIFGAYFAIPGSLLFFILRRRDVPLRGIFWLFAAFIVSCGTTHLIEAAIFWEPVYRLSGLAKLITAVISWTTVVALVRVMPSALNLPSISAANRQLRQEIANRKKLEQELTQARDQLERRSSQLTQRDRRFREAMEAADACAVRWAVDSNEVDWQLGGDHQLKLLSRAHQPFSTWAALLGPGDADRLREHARRAIRDSTQLDVDFKLDGDATTNARLRLAACPDPGTNGTQQYMIGMFRVLLPRDTRDT